MVSAIVDRTGRPYATTVSPEYEATDTGRRLASRLIHPGFGGLSIHFDPLGEAPETREHLRAGRPARWCRLRFEQIAQFVVEGNDCPGWIALQGREGRCKGSEIAYLQAVDQPNKTPSGRFALRRLPVFKKCGEFGAYLRFR